MLACPFCGALETARFDLDGRRFLVFACMFSPAVDPALGDAELGERLRTEYVEGARSGYFRSMCDRLHLYVTSGAGGERLKAAGGDAPSDGDPA